MNNLQKKESVTLRWLGQMGLLISTANTTICIDYYASPNEARQTPPPLSTDELAHWGCGTSVSGSFGPSGIDAFLGTHNHLDHIDHEAWKIWAREIPEAKFVFPRAHMDEVIEDLETESIGDSDAGSPDVRAIGLNAGESVQIGDFTIHAIPAAHEFLDLDSETGLYPHLQYIIEACGVRIHHAGDTLRYEGMLGILQAFGPFDVELLPIHGRDGTRYRRDCIGNMTYQEAADLAGELSPRMVIPGHWDMFADNSADPALLADYLDAKYPGRMECRIPKVMEEIVICGR